MKLLRKARPKRNPIFLYAVEHCCSETILALSKLADQENLDSVLPTAIGRARRGNDDDLAIVSNLIKHGASPLHAEDEFKMAVFDDRVDLVRILLPGFSSPSQQCLSAALCIAIKQGSLDMLDLLLEPKHRPDAHSLDAAVGKSRQSLANRSTALGRTLLGKCFAAGAERPETMELVKNGILGESAEP